MKHAEQKRYRQILRSSRTRTASILTVALVTTLLTFTPTNPVTADETTPNTTNENTETSNGTDIGSDSVSNAGGPLDRNQPSAVPSIPGTNSNLAAIEPTDDVILSDGGQSGGELGLSTDPSGQPTPTPIGEEAAQTPAPFGSVTGGTWFGVTWEIRDDNNPGVDYELYLGNPDGTTPETITPTVNMQTAPWYTNATYRANITEVNIRGPVKAPNSLHNAFNMFSKLEAWNDLSPTLGVAFFDTSIVTTMRAMFVNCSSLADVDGLADWNTGNVTNMQGMFQSCVSLVDADGLVGWNTISVTFMNGMFFNCKSLTRLDISGWDLSNVPYVISGSQGMQNMFPPVKVLILGAKSRLWPNAGVSDAPGANTVSFVTDGLQTNADKFMGAWQEIGTGTIDDPTGDIVGTGVDLMARSQNAVNAPGTYVWRPKYEVKLDGNGGNWAAVNPDTGLPATDAFLYVPRPATVGGVGQTVNLTSPNPITSLPTNTSSNFYGWTTTPDLLSTKTTTVGPVNSDTTVYALWSKLEIISSPTDFDFGSNPFSTSTRSLNLDPGSPKYTPADITNGFDLTVGSNALTKWQISATLDPFVDSVSLGGALPVGVGLDITGMTHKEQTSPPTTQLPVFNPNLSLPADGTTSQIIAGSGALPADGGGVWEISIPFNNVKLTVPPVSNAYVGRWKSTLTWSLEDLP